MKLTTPDILRQLSEEDFSDNDAVGMILLIVVFSSYSNIKRDSLYDFVLL